MFNRQSLISARWGSLVWELGAMTMAKYDGIHLVGLAAIYHHWQDEDIQQIEKS